jgi:hypothetical protein
LADTLHLKNGMFISPLTPPSARPHRRGSAMPVPFGVRVPLRLAAAIALGVLLSSAPRCRAQAAVSSSSLPNAPQPQANTTNGRPDNTVFGVHVGLGYPLEAGKWDIIINPGEHAQPLTAKDKLIFAAHEQVQPYVISPALVSAAFGQIRGADPKYGTDAGGFGERFGAAMLRGATDRLTGDGLLAAAFHQDPRFYREGEGNGTIPQRGLSAIRQTFLRRNDDGEERINASGILGHAVANFLALSYYPSVSQHASVAARGFGIAVSADAGSKLFLEFGPDVLYWAFRRNR